MQAVIFCILVLSSTTLLSSNAQMLILGENMDSSVKDTETVINNWNKMERVLKNAAKQGTSVLMSEVMGYAQDMNISSTCLRDGMHVLTGIRKLETWAMRFIDSSAKGINGMMIGTKNSFGDYDECLDTKAINQRPGKQKGQVMFTGKYCLMRMSPMLPPKRKFKSFHDTLIELNGTYKEGTLLGEIVKFGPALYSSSFEMAICVPSGCSSDDLNQGLKKVSSLTGVSLEIRRCEVKEETKFTPLMIAVMCIYSFVGLLVFLGTVVDLYCCYLKRAKVAPPFRILLCFSFVTNFRKITDTSSASQDLSCFNGIRFLTITWVIGIHNYAIFANRLLGQTLGFLKVLEEIEMQVFMKFIPVETFFFMGGFLVCYIATKHVIINKRKFNIKMFIFHRLWRILPTYIFVIIFVFLLELMASGPMAHDFFSVTTEQCRQSWWKNLLFINNFFQVRHGCISYTWYVAVDMQLYIGSLVILLPLLKSPKVGIIIAVLLAVFFCAFSSVYAYVYDFGPTAFYANPNYDDVLYWLEEYYVKPYPHAATYIIGVIAGYFLATNPSLKLSKAAQVCGWTAAITAGMACVYGPHSWITGKEPSTLEAFLFNGLQRPAWALCMWWMVICCATGQGGVVNYILSWKIWIPLGRLTFLAYLVHPLVISSVGALMGTTVTFRHALVIWMFFGNTVATYGISFVGSMMIESPFISLEKLLLPQRNRETSKPTQEEHVSQVVSVAAISNGKHSDAMDSTSTVLRSYKDIECKY